METNSAEPQKVDVGETILYTYDVIWRESEVNWASRWDIYLNEDHLVPTLVHWYPIFNDLIVLVVMSAMILSICIRNIKRDRAQHSMNDNQVDGSFGHDSADDVQGDSDNIDTGRWKVVHSDIFLPPPNPILYSVLVGSGSQLTVTFFVTLLLGAIGYVNPSNRGSMVNIILLSFMLCGIIAGYVSSRLHKAFHGTKEDLRKCTTYTATMFPGLCFITFIILNLLALLRKGVSVPIICIIIIIFWWCCVSIPLVHLGAYFGFKAEALSLPTAGTISPPGLVDYRYMFLLPVAVYGFYLGSPIGISVFILSLAIIGYKCSAPSLSKPISYPKINIVLAGVWTFGAIYVELFFIMTSLWMNCYYYVPGFTLLSFLLVLTTCAGIAVLFTHRALFNGSSDAFAIRWRWTVLFASGSVSGYIFIYSIMWFQTLDTYQGNEVLFASILYFGYMSLICFAVFLVTGAVGSITSMYFLHKIISPTRIPTEKGTEFADEKSDEEILMKASLLKENAKNERLDSEQTDENEINDV